MTLPVSISGISVAVAPVGPFKIAAGTVNYTIDSTPTTVSTGANLTGLASTTGIGQSFTNIAAVLTIPSITAVLYTSGSPTGFVYAEILNAAFGGTVVATSDQVATSAISASSLPGVGITFTFSSPPTISASAAFTVRLRRTVGDDVNFISCAMGSSGPYAGGNEGTWGGASWTQDGTFDLSLKVNGTITIASDAYYFFGRDGTTNTLLRAYKSTDPAASWSSINSVDYAVLINSISAFQAGNKIHILCGSFSGAITFHSYLAFDCLSDSFTPAVPETMYTGASTAGQTGAQQTGCSIVVRSTGEVVAFFNGVQTKTSGTFRARVYYSRRTGVDTWSAGVQVDANTAVDNTGPIAVLGSSDRLHLLFFNATNTIQRHLTSSNVLGTAASTGATAAALDVCTVNDSGTIRHVGFTAAQTFRWTSADNPTVTAASVAFGTPSRTVDDSLNVYAIYRNSADSDLYVKSSTDFGAIFGSGISVLTGTVAAADTNLSKNQSAYQRGSDVVFPYIVNDNGTLKYNEYTLRSVAVANIGTASGLGAANAVGASTAAANASAAAGTSTAIGVGTGIKAANASTAAGTSTASATGTQVVASPASAGGTSTAAATGATLGTGSGVAAGTGAAAATGSGIGIGAGTTAGLGDASATGRATAAGVGSAAGLGVALAEGSTVIAVAAAVGAAAGLGAAVAVGTNVLVTVGTAAATSTAFATGRSTATGTGAASGLGATTATGTGLAARNVSAAGLGAAPGAGFATAAVTGSAVGVGAALASSSGAVGLVGTASGNGAAIATGAATAAVAATAAGAGTCLAAAIGINAVAGTAGAISTATAAGRASAASIGQAAGTSTGLALTAGGIATATAAGLGSASAIGQQVVGAIGTASALGTATATGILTAASAGTAAATSTAVAFGTAVRPAVGTTAGLGASLGNATGVIPRAATASGVGTVIGAGAGIYASIGTALATSSAQGAGAATAASVGVAVGVGEAFGRQVTAAVGIASGFGFATGISFAHRAHIVSNYSVVATKDVLMVASSRNGPLDLVAQQQKPSPLMGTRSGALNFVAQKQKMAA